MKSEIETERKLIDTQRIEVINKKNSIQKKIKSVETKLNLIAGKDPRIIERYLILKNIFEKNLKEVNNIKKTTEEVKCEFMKIMKEEGNKRQIIEENLNPKWIKKELIVKQISFEDNMHMLEREVITSLESI